MFTRAIAALAAVVLVCACGSDAPLLTQEATTTTAIEASSGSGLFEALPNEVAFIENGLFMEAFTSGTVVNINGCVRLAWSDDDIGAGGYPLVFEGVSSVDVVNGSEIHFLGVLGEQRVLHLGEVAGFAGGWRAVTDAARELLPPGCSDADEMFATSEFCAPLPEPTEGSDSSNCFSS